MCRLYLPSFSQILLNVKNEINPNVLWYFLIRSSVYMETIISLLELNSSIWLNTESNSVLKDSDILFHTIFEFTDSANDICKLDVLVFMICLQTDSIVSAFPTINQLFGTRIKQPLHSFGQTFHDFI